MKAVSVKLSPSITNTPPAFMSATKKALPSGDTRMSWGMPPFESRRYPMALRATRSIFARLPWNSQVKIAKRPSIEKSAWLIPAHCGASSELCSVIVCGSRKSSRLSASATTMAERPSGVKYML